MNSAHPLGWDSCHELKFYVYLCFCMINRYVCRYILRYHQPIGKQERKTKTMISGEDKEITAPGFTGCRTLGRAAFPMHPMCTTWNFPFRIGDYSWILFISLYTHRLGGSAQFVLTIVTVIFTFTLGVAMTPFP